MILPRFTVLTAFFLMTLTASKCQDVPADVQQKIEFDYAAVDDQGLINGEVAIDYEFCIPRDESKVDEVKKIVPDVRIPRMAKGRIGCADDQWLVIVTTNDKQWKSKLMQIASLPYVKRIVQTHYE